MTIPQLSKEQQQQIVAGALMLAAAGYIYTQYFFKPTMKTIKESKEKIVELNGRITQLQMKTAKLDRLKREIEVLNKEWAKLEENLAKDRDLPKVLDFVMQLARKHQITILSIAPKKPSPQPLYNEISYQMTIVGAYHDVAQFLVSIGKEKRIFHAKKLSFNPATPTLTSPKATLQVGMELVTFQHKGG
ncbi:type 4a pilus biogenesis protein PilO [Elusimicrobiota bacterium]